MKYTEYAQTPVITLDEQSGRRASIFVLSLYAISAMPPDPQRYIRHMVSGFLCNPIGNLPPRQTLLTRLGDEFYIDVCYTCRLLLLLQRVVAKPSQEAVD